jgi:hypothetical protein
MAKPREGWKPLNVEIPEFAHDDFEALRIAYGDKHGVSPSQPLAVAALAHVATVETLMDALLKYREECKSRDVRHGW